MVHLVIHSLEKGHYNTLVQALLAAGKGPETFIRRISLILTENADFQLLSCELGGVRSSPATLQIEK